MRDFETIRRSILRRSHIFEGKSSWPFISGDTYRTLCPVRFDHLPDFRSIQKLDGYEGRVFVTAGLACNFLETIRVYPNVDLSGVVLMIHNGDKIPSLKLFRVVHERFRHIYSVNWLDSLPNVSPLPIGLENLSYMRNGVTRDFRRQHKFPRDIPLLLSFSDHTNPEERKAARNEAKAIKGAVFLSPSTTPREYRALVSRSKFVLSPPGNGPDCHRTWESIYLGAIPIVKESSWPFKSLNLPVASVARWDQLIQVVNTFDSFKTISISELNTLFLKEFLDAK